MKIINIILILFAINHFNILSNEKIDITKKPESLPQIEYKFPEYSEKILSNGIKVFFIEDKEQPTFSIRLLIPGGSSVEGEKKGLAKMTAEVLLKGAAERTALDIAKAIDGIGASITTNTYDDYFAIEAVCLKKHINLVLSIYADIILKPNFPEDELEKLVKQEISNLQAEKAEGMNVAGKLSSLVVYGDKHPYAALMTEESLNKISVDDVKDFYKKYFISNNATISIVGDIDPLEITVKLEKYFKGWKPVELTPQINIPEPNPKPVGVYFVERPGSVQSSIIITNKGLPRAHKDFESFEIATDIMGLGFAGRLFRTLREIHSYTYTPFGYTTRNKYANQFICGADVRNSVTDSAITVIFEQLYSLTKEAPSEEEFNRILRSKIGNYLMRFEDTEFLASLVQNTDFMGLSIDYFKRYPTRIMQMDRFNIQRIANRYLNPRGSFIIVVGNSEVQSKLDKFGKIFTYDLDLKEKVVSKANISPDELIQKYINAIGGQSFINDVKSIIAQGTGELTVQGRTFPGEVFQITQSNKRYYLFFDFGVINQKIWIDSNQAWLQNSAMASPEKLEGNELYQLSEKAELFPETKLIKKGYKCDVVGIQDGNIILKSINSIGKETTYTFDSKTYFLKKIEYIEEDPQGQMPVTEKYNEYIEINGVKIPSSIETISPYYSTKIKYKYELNKEIPNSEFVPPNQN